MLDKPNFAPGAMYGNGIIPSIMLSINAAAVRSDKKIYLCNLFILLTFLISYKINFVITAVVHNFNQHSVWKTYDYFAVL